MKRPEKEEPDEPGGEDDSPAEEVEEGAGDEATEEASQAPAEAPRAPKEPFATRLRHSLRTYRFHISVVVSILGFVTFFFGLFAWTPLASSPGIGPVEQALLGASCTSGPNYVNGACTATGPDWTLAMLPGGGLLGAIGAYLAITYTVARRRFEHLMKTKSKAEFLRNVTEAEDLLWDLTPEDEIRLVRKKQDLKIRL